MEMMPIWNISRTKMFYVPSIFVSTWSFCTKPCVMKSIPFTLPLYFTKKTLHLAI